MSTIVTCTDMFCGAGGSSQGAVNTGVEVRMAANHWPLAIETHNTNFPETDHDCADITQVMPQRWPTTDVLWASPECTNHSLAKGVKKWSGQLDLFGTHQQADLGAVRSRATMWDVVRFAEHHDYKLIITENVVDARKWRLFESWIHAMKAMDYQFHICYFNSMFFGVPQSRDRMYIVFWKKNMPAPDLSFKPWAYCPACDENVQAVQVFKKTFRWGRYGRQGQYYYRCPKCHSITAPYYTPAAAAIDWSDKGTRIGDRTRPLKPKTMRRIEYGLEKYLGQVMQVSTVHSGDKRAKPLDDPLMTQTTRQSTAVTLPPSAVLVFRNNMSAKSPVQPLSTISASAINHGLLMSYYGTGGLKSTDEPMGTLTTKDRHALILSYYSRDNAVKPATEPLGTISTEPRHAVIRSKPKVKDCYFRMLKPNEIGEGMAFNRDYIVLGTKKEQVRQYGNAVTPPVATWLYERCVQIFNK